MKVIGGTVDYIVVETRRNHTIRIRWDDHEKIKIVVAAVDNPEDFLIQALIYKAANSFDEQDEVASESGTQPEEAESRLLVSTLRINEHPATIAINFVNLCSMLGNERAERFVVLVIRSLWVHHIQVEFIAPFIVKVSRGDTPSPFIATAGDLARIAHDEIAYVASVAGVECEFTDNE